MLRDSSDSSAFRSPWAHVTSHGAKIPARGSTQTPSLLCSASARNINLSENLP